MDKYLTVRGKEGERAREGGRDGERNRGREEERQRKRNLPSAGLFPKYFNSQNVARSPEPNVGLPYGQQRPMAVT